MEPVSTLTPGFPYTPPPPNQSVITINGYLKIYFTTPIPNRWWRTWQYLFFGFVWERVEMS